jgi:hypothetical protein
MAGVRGEFRVVGKTSARLVASPLGATCPISSPTAESRRLGTLREGWLSGRQTKRKRPFTAPALLAGLCSLLAMLDTLENYDINAMRDLINKLSLPIPLLKGG